MDLKSKNDDELRALLPSGYDVAADEGTTRGLKRMRWINAIRRSMKPEIEPKFVEAVSRARASWIKDNCEPQDHRKYLVDFSESGGPWVLFASFDDKKLALFWKNELKDAETKTRLRWRD